MNQANKFGIVIPAANEADTIEDFSKAVITHVKKLNITVTIYFVLDKASKDNTRTILENISKKEKRVKVVFEPKNKTVVDAYIRGFRQALSDGCDFIIEMDCGFSHLPSELHLFVSQLQKGYDCVFGIRPLWSPWYAVPLYRRVYSLGGTILSNILLGTHFTDMTSGYEAFTRKTLQTILARPLLSTGHFYQTEIRYRAHKFRYKEVPITYTSPSPRVKWKYIDNAFRTLFFYTKERFGIAASH